MIGSKQGYSSAAEVGPAVAELADQISQPGALGILYFASSDYDEQALAQAMAHRFGCPLWGCSSAGVFGSSGYFARGIQAVSLSGSASITPFYCESLHDLEGIRRVAQGMSQAGSNAFALLLLDGLSQEEEEFVHHLYSLVGDIPMVGGSAGGSLDFQRNWLAWGERVYPRGGLVLLVETDVPFRLVKFEHSVCSDRRFVVTRSDPRRRVVYEINGKPAAREYARLLLADSLREEHLARHPWVLELGGQQYLRAIRAILPDGSLQLYCSVEEGLILSVGFPLDPLSVAERHFAEVKKQLGSTSLILGFDCVLRRLELEHSGLNGAMAQLIERERVVGFNTFGEQFQAVHMNQTFTGLALGGQL